ncbi:hypothetical protein DID78_00250 [Candidatus Marinamargulisbacteria bacterium SCGC AG-343-D04]|nr:hypothetical protein DID78_00250 [Candidatus Marinamargulisbacteria bacterium SCGC AG-343-D04]
MKKVYTLLAALLLFSITCLAQNTIYTLSIKGPIGPAYADYFNRGLQTAIQNDAQALLLQLDTPGGLDSSMRYIIQNILSSPIPVITYISPSGARGASAGTYIMYASHIAAMAPGTNLGAATPVSLADPQKDYESPENDTLKKSLTKMEKKVINDAVAYIKSLAELRNRNSEWAEKAVIDAESLSAKEALEKNVIDIIAPTIPELLQQLEDKEITIKQTIFSFSTPATLIDIPMDIKTKILSIITSPNIAYMLLIAGIYCIIFEFSNPGLVIPGVLGTLSLVLALYGLNLLPISFIGLTLILVGIACLIAEAFIPSFGILGISGTGLFLFGSFMLIEPNSLGLGISTSLIITSTVINLLFFGLIVTIIVKIHKKPSIIGLKSLVGITGLSLEAFKKEGQIRINGEIWNARSKIPIKKNTKVVVRSIIDRTLIIEPIKEEKNHV